MPVIPVVHTFNLTPREEYKTRPLWGDSSQTQPHSEIPEGRFTISDWGWSKSQWLAVLFFRSSGRTPISNPEFLLIMLQQYVLIAHNHCFDIQIGYFCPSYYPTVYCAMRSQVFHHVLSAFCWSRLISRFPHSWFRNIPLFKNKFYF